MIKQIVTGKAFFLWVFLLAFCCYCAESERISGGPSRNSKWSLISTDMKYCGSNVLHFIKAPLNMNAASYTVAGALLGVSALTLLADESARHEVLESNSDDMDDFILPWQYYGTAYFSIGIAASFYIGGLGFSNNWLRETGRECLMSLTCAALVSTSLKFAVGRERPCENEGPFDFDPFSFRRENHSLPSGHTTAAFALSTVLASRIRNPFAAVALYATACMTAAQRVYSDNHWFSDVSLGAVIGTVSGLFIVHDSDKLAKQTVHSIPHLTPFVTASGTGVCITYLF